MRRLGSWGFCAAAWVGFSAAAPVSAQTVDFEAATYITDKTFVGADQWAQPLGEALGNPADNFKVQAGAGGNAGKWAHVLTSGTTTAYRPFNGLSGILDVRWKWRALNDSAHFCLGVSGATLSPRAGNRGLACIEPRGGLSAQGAGAFPTASGESWKASTWYYMRMVLDNSQGTNKFALYIAEDSLRGVERPVVPATTMGGSGAFTRLVLRGEGGIGYVDVDDISWEATTIWQGGSEPDSGWSLAKNWSDNLVPDSLTHVLFTAGAGGCILDRNASVKSITVGAGYKGTLNLGSQTLTVGGNADFTGGRYLFYAGGQIRLPSPRGQSFKGPDSGKTLAPVRHDGAGTLRLDTRALYTAGLSQLQGGFDFNGFDLVVIGDLTIKNGRPGTLRNLDGRSVSVGRATRLEGVSKDTLLGMTSSPKGWNLTGSVADSVVARFATLGNSHAGLATGYAFQSVDAGGNSGWIFLGPPSILVQPKDTAVKVGESGWFKVSSSSKSGVSYQWLRDDKEIPGATDSIYLFPGAKRSDSGSIFTCRLSNIIGATFTNPAKIKVSFPAPTVSPAPQTFGDSLTVRMAASVPGAKVFYSRNGSAWQESPTSLLLKDSSLIRAFGILGADTSTYASWNFPKQSLPQLPEPEITPESFTFDDSVQITMTPPVPDAVIHYTVDESVPDSTKPKYGKPFTIKATTTLSAIAYKAGFRPSLVHTHIYIRRSADTLSPPKALPAGGPFTDSVVVRLSPPAEAPQASIYYLIGALGPYKFQDSLILRETTILKAIAISGSRYSDTARWEFTRRLEAPRAAPASRTFPDTLRVSVTGKSAGASVFYTVDGSDPTAKSLPFPGQGLLLDSTTLLKAVAVKGTDVSAIVSETYTLVPGMPSASPRGGDYSSLISVQLTSKAARAEIYYTLDGTDPGPERGLPPYSAPFSLDTSATLKAVAVAGKGAGMQRSPFLIENYTFIRPGPRVLGPGQRIDLSSNYSLVSPLAGAAPVDVEVIAVDSLKSLKGFRDILFGIRLSVSQGAVAFPKVIFNAPAGEARSLYSVNPGGSARYLTSRDTSEILAPGTYFMAVDTLAPLITFSGETFTGEDSTRLVVSIQDNVSNLSLDLERSDKPAAGFAGREINGTTLLTVSLKNPKGSLLPLTLRLSVDDHSRKTRFPSDGAVYPMAQRIMESVRTPSAFHIGSNADNPWDLISVPLALDPPLTMAQLRKNNSVPGMEGVTLDPATGKYRHLKDNESLPPGAAMWIADRASMPTMVFPALQTAGRRGSGSYPLSLRHGWNLVANPSLATLYWPISRDLPDLYDASLLKGLHAWNAITDRYETSETLEPWRGYFVYYKGQKDTTVVLLSEPPAAPAPIVPAAPPAAKNASGPSLLSGFNFRLRLAEGMTLRLGATAKAGDGIGVEDEPQPISPKDDGPRLFSARDDARLGTDLVRWNKNEVYVWKVVAGIPARGLSARADASQGGSLLEGSVPPEGYSAWAISRKRGLRFQIGLAPETGADGVPKPGIGVPIHPGFTDSLEIMVGPTAELEARLASIPRTVGAFEAKLMASPGSFALGLNLPRAARLNLTLWALDGRALERETLDLPEGRYHLIRNRGGRGYATGMYVLTLDRAGGDAPGTRIPGRTALKIAIP